MQTTSIEDVLSQLPGGQTLQANTLAQSKSAMADAQRLALRSQNSTELDNPSFGTAIEIDGVRLSNNSNYTDGAAGVDTRNVGIHNIESIEVTTGLPSVEHVGWGDAVKLPSSAMLFPTPTYTDRIAFASTSTNGIASYAYYTTPQKAIYNEDLKWQRNRKSEIGIDMDIRIARISVTGYMK